MIVSILPSHHGKHDHAQPVDHFTATPVKSSRHRDDNSSGRVSPPNAISGWPCSLWCTVAESAAVRTDPSDGRTLLQNIGLGALAAIASGVGVIGALTFVGGAVEIARYRGVGLPGPFSVPLVPRTKLLTSGADQLFAPFVFTAGVITIGIAYLLARRRLDDRIDRVLLALLLGGGVVGALIYFRHQAGKPAPAPLAVGDRETAFTATILILVLGACSAYALGRAERSEAGILRSPRLVAFLAVLATTALLFSAVETFARNEWQPEVHPVAIIGPHFPGGLTGVLVGEDSGHVYVGIIHKPLANIHSKRLQARIIAVNRADIAAFAVGGLFPMTNYPSSVSASLRHEESRDMSNLTSAEQAMLYELQSVRPS